MANYERDTILRDLKKNVAEVFFTKVNGEKRAMKCTLMPELLPQSTDLNHLEEQHGKQENLSTVGCWDIEKGGWRSFRVESVEMVQLLDAYNYM